MNVFTLVCLIWLHVYVFFCIKTLFPVFVYRHTSTQEETRNRHICSGKFLMDYSLYRTIGSVQWIVLFYSHARFVKSEFFLYSVCNIQKSLFLTFWLSIKTKLGEEVSVVRNIAWKWGTDSDDMPTTCKILIRL